MGKRKRDKNSLGDIGIFSLENPMQGLSDVIVYSGNDNEPDYGDDGHLDPGSSVLFPIAKKIVKEIIRKIGNGGGCCCCCGGGSAHLIDESEIILYDRTCSRYF